eukprot:934980-Heterocapsa_arctica.AAC.1
MPVLKVSSLVLMVSNIGGRVVLPSECQHGSSEIVYWSSDITCLDVELSPMIFRVRAKSSFSLSDSIDQNLFNNINNGLNLPFVNNKKADRSTSDIRIGPES